MTIVLFSSSTMDLDRVYLSISCYPFSATNMTIWWWQKAVDQPALIHVLLGTSALHRARLIMGCDASSLLAQALTRESLRFRHKTVELLRRTIRSPSKASLESMILVVASLICVEVSINFTLDLLFNFFSFFFDLVFTLCERA
jgi:hypothetical protein